MKRIHLLTFEESQIASLSKVLELRGRIPFLSHLIITIRAFGAGIVALCQNPWTKVVTELTSNTATQINFHLGGTEVQGMQICQGLTREQGQMLNHIQAGEAIFKTSIGYTEPVLVKIRNVTIERISDQELEELMADKWARLMEKVVPVEQTQTLTNVVNQEICNAAAAPSKATNIPKALLTAHGEADLSEDDKIFLADIRSRPYSWTEERFRQCTLSRNRAIRSKERLCRMGYLIEIKLKQGSRGKPPSVLIPSAKGAEYLGITFDKGKGSWHHKNIQALIIHLSKQEGLTAKVEDAGADVSIQNGNGELIAVEVELRDTNVTRNLTRNLDNGFREVWIVVEKETEDKARKRIDDLLLAAGKVRIILLENILLELKKLKNERRIE